MNFWWGISSTVLIENFRDSFPWVAFRKDHLKSLRFGNLVEHNSWSNSWGSSRYMVKTSYRALNCCQLKLLHKVMRCWKWLIGRYRLKIRSRLNLNENIWLYDRMNIFLKNIFLDCSNLHQQNYRDVIYEHPIFPPSSPSPTPRPSIFYVHQNIFSTSVIRADVLAWFQLIELAHHKNLFQEVAAVSIAAGEWTWFD